ncbi:hypothetical protein ACOU9P_000556 [Enterococcus faecium]|uniref:hypothetical protein n=1 Tax=Enterococcus sp. 10F3_DIV0382 TaxID=1834165 RepID=UPI000A32D02B|nr:hypothetical protein [Enterococcus sp. 10F3_DIV0382]EGP5147824.1 hypothetical protein [Enterococcus faecium]EGP5196872.1 hypothetical protein [Enterococcus faecium]EGP5246310.1 hypothetical protein [Enterococcus faecium]EGP5310442.1 hypothetical protein [Enterococcus faecium]EGP5328806.1 hypothetical protein [Enterococcus faecium]
MNVEVYSISDIEDIFKEQNLDIKEYLSRFTIGVNSKIQDFFRDSALARNRENVCRTFIVIDLDSDPLDNIVGYFSLTITYRKINEDVSKKLKRKISSDAERHNIFSATLISKLGRADKYKGKISGKEIMNLALETCYQIYELTGLRHVCVDYYDNEALEEFYLNKSGFKKYQHDDEQGLNYCFYKFS